MRAFIVAADVALVILALLAPDLSSSIVRSAAHGFGWGLGREAAHRLVHHL